MATTIDTPGIVITGAGSGIGRATARLFLDRGWRVALIGRREAPLSETAAGHAAASVLPGDVTDEGFVDAAFAGLAQRWGRIDALFNNAGSASPAVPFDQVQLSDWQRVVDINLTGMFLCARAAFRAMRAQDPRGGRIIMNGSISAHAPRPGMAAYTATKHAVTGLTRSIALDGRACNIACGQIDIGNALTDIAAGFAQGATQADGSTRPEPVMPVAEVARAVWHMATVPEGTNVQFMTVMATNMPFIGRG